MKQGIRNCLATTALSLLLLVTIASIYQAEYLVIVSVFQTFLANIVIHIGLYMLQKFESRYVFIEITVELSYILAVVIGFGYVFGWYSSTPPWILSIMVVILYLAGGMIDVFRIKTDLDQINQELDCRRKRLSEQKT